MKNLSKLWQKLPNMGGKAASQGQKPSERKETSSNKGQRDGQKQSADKRTNITPGQQIQLAQPIRTSNVAPKKDKYRRFHKTGPELLITRLLMVNGPLKVKELWRSYEKILKENEKNGEPEKLDYFTSLTNLKKTVKLMRVKGKLVSNGYSRKQKDFKGWKIQEKRALKYVHPQLIEKIQQEIIKRERL